MRAETGSHLRGRASRLGVATEFWDGAGQRHEVGEDTLRAVLAALGNGAGPDHRPLAATQWPPVVVAAAGQGHRWRPPVGQPAHVVLESGERRALPAELPGGLPAGYHTVMGATGQTRLVVAPPSCFLPTSLAAGGRAWGWAVQPYAIHRRASWGIGDLGDLATLASDGALAGDFVLINPLSEPPSPGHPGPYRPSSRMFRNPLYLDVEQLPERAALTDGERARFDELAASGRSLTGRGLINRAAVFSVKNTALRLCFAAMDRLPGRRRMFGAWYTAHPLVQDFAVFRSLQAVYGQDWRSWPPAYQRPREAAVDRFRDQHAEEVSYQAWLQWLIEAQLTAIPESGIGIINDFPVGVAQGGFDTWLFQDQVASGVTIGAPPDAFAPQGQDWGLAAFAPGGLAACGYEPFIQSIRAAMTGAGGLRIDHVMALFRLFLVPNGADAAHGTYVQYPADDLLGIVALESQRAQALVVGEDLGNVGPGVRERLAASNVLSSRIVWFERDPSNDTMPRRAASYPWLAMAAVGTHDLPTVAGFFSDSDLYHQRSLGLITSDRFEAALEANHRLQQELLRLLQEEGLLTETSPDAGAVAAALHAFLGRTPAMLVALRLEDILQVHERPNLPGTSAQRRPQNWRLPFPAPLEELRNDPRVKAAMAAMRLLMHGTGHAADHI